MRQVELLVVDGKTGQFQLVGQQVGFEWLQDQVPLVRKVQRYLFAPSITHNIAFLAGTHNQLLQLLIPKPVNRQELRQLPVEILL